MLALTGWAADDDKVLFTMNLVAGGSLVHLVGDYGPLPPHFICTLLDQLSAGLTAVHEEGLVHRGIKPANVLLEATGTSRPQLRLSDFGVAMRLDDPRLTETHLVVGTPGYICRLRHGDETAKGSPHPPAHPGQPVGSPHALHHDPTHPLRSPLPRPTAPSGALTAEYTARGVQVPSPSGAVPQQVAGPRSPRRPGPPVRVAVPVLLLSLACYAVGFWALARI